MVELWHRATMATMTIGMQIGDYRRSGLGARSILSIGRIDLAPKPLDLALQCWAKLAATFEYSIIIVGAVVDVSYFINIYIYREREWYVLKYGGHIIT